MSANVIFEGDLPSAKCANCDTTEGLKLIPYQRKDKERIVALLFLCELCGIAALDGGLTAKVEVIFKGQR